PCHEKQEAGFWLRQKALEAEGHRTCPSWLYSVSTVEARRHRAWPATAFVRLQVPAQEASGRIAFGAGGKIERWQADCGKRVRCERAEDAAVPRSARCIEG